MPSPRARRTRPLRIATYNILVGGPRREELITAVLSRIDADVIALQEVCNLQFLGELAGRLGMQTMVGEPSDPLAGCHIAILTRLPVRGWQNRQHVGRMLRSHLHCDIETGWATLPVIGVHNVHLAARFGERAKGEARRMRELTAVLDGIGQAPPLPHVILGDFNSVAPGDDVAATRFFRKPNELRRRGLVTVPRAAAPRAGSGVCGAGPSATPAARRTTSLWSPISAAEEPAQRSAAWFTSVAVAAEEAERRIHPVTRRAAPRRESG